MDYFLQPAFLSPPPPLAITAENFSDLKRSRVILDAVFSFEENYDLLVGNFVELQNSALAFSTESLARQRHGYEDFFEITAEMNRRAVNFLSSARLFVDQILQRIGKCGCEKELVKVRLGAEYDNAFEYRFMEALRNHVQHSGSAIHSLSIGGEWRPPSERDWKIFSLGAYTEKRFLALDDSFKKSVLKECPNKVDFLAAARHYLSSLSDVHDFARSHIDESTLFARSTFSDAIEKYKDFSGESALGLSAFTSGDNSTPIAIFLDWDEVRIKLAKRNRNLRDLGKSVIASSII